MAEILLNNTKTGQPVIIDTSKDFCMLRKEYVQITGDYTTALILEYLIRATVFHCEVDRELERRHKSANDSAAFSDSLKNHGWFYKSAREIAEQCFLYMNGKPIHTKVVYARVGNLVSMGIVEKYVQKMPKITHYRVNFERLVELIHTNCLRITDDTVQKIRDSLILRINSCSSGLTVAPQDCKEVLREEKKEGMIDSLFTSGAGTRECVSSGISSQEQKHAGSSVATKGVPSRVPSDFVLPDDENENVPLSLRPDYTPSSVASPIEFKKQKVVYDTKPVSTWSVKDLFEYFRDRFQDIVKKSLPPIPGNKRGIIYKGMNRFRESLGFSMEDYKEFVDLVLYIFPKESLTVTINTIHSNAVYEMILQKREKYEDTLLDAVVNEDVIEESAEAIVERLIQNNPAYKEIYGDN